MRDQLLKALNDLRADPHVNKKVARLDDPTRYPLFPVLLQLMLHDIFYEKPYFDTGANGKGKLISTILDEDSFGRCFPGENDGKPDWKRKSRDTLEVYIRASTNVGTAPRCGFADRILLAVALLRLSSQQQAKPRIHAILQQWPLLDVFGEVLGAPPPPQQQAKITPPVALPYWNLDINHAGEEAAKSLNLKNGETQAYYGYRHSSKAGKVVKFALTIHRDAAGLPRFRAHYSADATRTSEGIVLATASKLFFISHDDEHGFKVMVFRGVKGAARRPGLILTVDPELDAVSGRVLLVRQNEVRDDLTGEFLETTLPERGDIAEFIRNEIGFNVTQDIYLNEGIYGALLALVSSKSAFLAGWAVWGAGLKNFRGKGARRKISQKELVKYVEDLLSSQDRPVFELQREGGRAEAFNPAAHQHYPFNQSLIWSSLTLP